MRTAAKKLHNFDEILQAKGIFRKIFHGEMLIRTMPTLMNNAQIFCKIILNSSHCLLYHNLDMTDLMGPGKLVHHMQNPAYTYNE